MEVRSVEAIFTALNTAQVRYLVVGGLAVNAHGYLRVTRDVDLVIELEPANIIRGLEALLAIGYAMSIPVTPAQFADAALRERWRAEKSMIVLKLWSDAHRRTPVDVFVYEPFDFARESALASHEVVMEGVRAPVVTLATLVEMKRAAGRPRDLADLDDLARVQRLRQERS